jgi:antitoxin component YwqK of YwqJK toxin-antitoxin module
MWKLCQTAVLATMMLMPACSDAPPPNEKKSAGTEKANDEEFDGKYIRTVKNHHYVAKSAHGRAIWYYPSGKKKTARTFRYGKLEGPMVMWYESGMKKYAVHYAANMKTGKAMGWYDDGKAMFVIGYEQGRRSGKETWFWKDGTSKKRECEWYRGRMTNEQAWAEDGKEIKIPSTRPRGPIRQPSTSKGN